MLGALFFLYRADFEITDELTSRLQHRDLIASDEWFVRIEIPFPWYRRFHYQYSRWWLFPFAFVFYQSVVDRFYLCLHGCSFLLDCLVWKISWPPILAPKQKRSNGCHMAGMKHNMWIALNPGCSAEILWERSKNISSVIEQSLWLYSGKGLWT